MTREESINNAAVRFATQFIDTGETDFYGHCVKEQGLDHAEYRGFIAGAKWADSNPKDGLISLSWVWHDSSEIPQHDALILFQSTYGDILLIRFQDRKSSMATIQRWAYVDDLLPEGGKVWK